jgi:hypothetical protein
MCYSVYFSLLILTLLGFFLSYGGCLPIEGRLVCFFVEFDLPFGYFFSFTSYLFCSSFFFALTPELLGIGGGGGFFSGTLLLLGKGFSSRFMFLRL